jgi:hypothetical protein
MPAVAKCHANDYQNVLVNVAGQAKSCGHGPNLKADYTRNMAGSAMALLQRCEVGASKS